jgi:hypothetical protein
MLVMLKNEAHPDPYDYLKEDLEKSPFITIIGKYDHTLGPKALYSSIEIEDKEFIRNLLRDALSTKNKTVILDYDRFYSQVYKIEIEDINARGRKQLYAIILLRDVEYPLIPIIHFKRIEAIFHKIETEKILSDNKIAFESFFKEIRDIYVRKEEVLPLESVNLQIRSGINTIQGFCELILEEKNKNKGISEKDVISYIEMMLDSCNEIINALKKPLSSASK